MAGCGLRCSKCGKTARVIWDSTPAEVSKILGRDCGYLIDGLKAKMASSDLDWSDKIHCSVCGGEMMPLGNEGKDFELRCKLQKEWVNALVKFNNGKTDDDDEEVDYFSPNIQKLKGLSAVAIKMLDVMTPTGEPQRHDLVHYVFLRKTVRLILAIYPLISMHLEEEAQILMRSLVDLKISFNYFSLIAKDDFDKAFNRIFDFSALNKIKMLNALDYKIGDHFEDKGNWDKILKEIKSRYTNDEFKKLKKYGFSGLSTELMADRTNNTELYNYSFRKFSANAHLSNLGEQLQHIISPNSSDEYERSRAAALLYVYGKCSFDVIKCCNERLGKPIDEAELDTLRVHDNKHEKPL